MLCVLFVVVVVVGVEQRAEKNDFHARENGKREKRNAGNFLCKGCANPYLRLKWFKTVRDRSEDLENNRRIWGILTALNLEGVSIERPSKGAPRHSSDCRIDNQLHINQGMIRLSYIFEMCLTKPRGEAKRTHSYE